MTTHHNQSSNIDWTKPNKPTKKLSPSAPHLFTTFQQRAAVRTFTSSSVFQQENDHVPHRTVKNFGKEEHSVPLPSQLAPPVQLALLDKVKTFFEFAHELQRRPIEFRTAWCEHLASKTRQAYTKNECQSTLKKWTKNAEEDIKRKKELYPSTTDTFPTKTS